MNKKEIDNVVDWIKNYVKSANANGVVVGMSGGKDSLVVACLCAKALGKENVFGIIMPNGKMKDKNDALQTCKLLGINFATINISNCYNAVIKNTKKALSGKKLLDITTINTAPRIRMTTLYAIAGSLNYLVANTSNLSETMIGYSTKWGDNVGDFAPIARFTKNEVCEIGILLGLPEKLVNKTPNDGLSGKSDEEKLGFGYDELDNFIRKGKKGKNFDVILKKHKIASHKINPIKKYDYNKKNYFEEN